MNNPRLIHSIVALFIVLVLTQFNCNIGKTPPKLGYEKSLKILNRIEETEVLERCFFRLCNDRILKSSPAPQETLRYEHDPYVIEVHYISLVNSGELLIKTNGFSLVAEDSKNIRYARLEDTIRDDTVFIKTDTIDIILLSP